MDWIGSGESVGFKGSRIAVEFSVQVTGYHPQNLRREKIHVD